MMNWIKTTLLSLTLSVAFFFYFGQFVGDFLTILAIQEITPLLRSISDVYGTDWARIFARSTAFLLAVAGSFLFILPIGQLISEPAKLGVAALIMITPVAGRHGKQCGRCHWDHCHAIRTVDRRIAGRPCCLGVEQKNQRKQLLARASLLTYPDKQFA